LSDALQNVKRKIVERDFDHVMEMALKFAKGQNAIYLPGWCGPGRESARRRDDDR